jgi:hypothetical protein
MADEKKPKIDLKARLGKASGAATPPPVGVGMPVPPPQFGSRPPPAIPPPVVPGIPVGPPSPFGGPSAFGGGAPAIDPSNPLSAVAAPYRAPAPPAPPQPQRIEVDEHAVQTARSGARKQGMVIAAVAAVAFAGVGYIAGQAAENGAGRTKSKGDAVELAADVAKAKVSLATLEAKLDAGRNQLTKERKFPDGLANDLGGINIDFDGSKLAGRRFSGFPTETTAGLVEFITEVQALNDRKGVVRGLLNKLQKPLTEQLAAPAGQTTIAQVVIVDKDPAGNPTALLAQLAQPITFTPPQLNLPAEFTFSNPMGGGNTKLPAYKGGDIVTKPSAVYVAPKTFDKVCPNEQAGAAAQLAVQLGSILKQIKGEGQAQADVIQESKPGLTERADKLITSLEKVGKSK